LSGDPAARARELAATLRALADLAEKYRLLDELRAGTPGRTNERRDAIREVAARFPAAMREWDEASPEEIQRRRDAVYRALSALVGDLERGGGLSRLGDREHQWMLYSAEIHAGLRDALRVKRWLAGRPLSDEIAAEAERLFEIDRPRLARIAAPESGRFSDLIYEEVAARHGVTVEEMKGFLFPGNEEP
jgi:hypothetical protein